MSERKTGRITKVFSRFSVGQIADAEDNWWYLRHENMDDRFGLVIGKRVEFTPGPKLPGKKWPVALEVVVLKEAA